MIVANGVGAFASTPWTVNPGDYRYDMSLYLDVTFATSGKMDYSQYDVAVFHGDVCRGVAERLSLGDGKECLYLRARSNQESGETMTFKYYNKETEEIQPIDDVSFNFESNGRLGYPSDPYIVKIAIYYDVILSAGTGGTIDQVGGRIAEGTKLTIKATPDEGYHFEQWSDSNTENPRTIIVNDDITLAAEFGVNTYKLVYTVDGKPYKEYQVNYGTTIIPEAYPQKEGHTFSGWEGLPETMPANDVTVNGTFTVNTYKLTYVVEGTTYKTIDVDFGTAITAEPYPEKEGHTFSGWEGLPETMPAHNVTVSGTFSINSYNLTVYLDNVIYLEQVLKFGTPLNIPDPEIPDGKKFDGWNMEIPETMPSHDLEIHGTTSDYSGIEAMFTDKNIALTVYNINGVLISKNISVKEAENILVPGLYIINGKKILIK